MKISFAILFLTICLYACKFRHREKVTLAGIHDQKAVIYQTTLADFYIGHSSLVEYCHKADNGEPNDFVFRQIIDYLNSYPTSPILIPDTLGTIVTMVSKSETLYPRDTIMRIRDEKHPYAYISSEMQWIIIELARKGKLRIYDNALEQFVGYVNIDDIDDNLAGITNIETPNGTIVLSNLRWIK